MSLIILKELQRYTVNINNPITEDDFIYQLKLNPNSEQDLNLYHSIIQELDGTSFFKHTKPINKLEDINTNYDDTNIDTDIKNCEKETYHFTFTGILIINGVSLIIYPKHINSIQLDIQNQFKKFKQITEVIQKYQKRNQVLSLSEDLDNNISNKLGLAIQILNYFEEYGLYEVENTVVEENGFGSILWEKTINEKPIVLSGKSPIYLNTYTDAYQIDEFHLIRQIQLAVLNDIKYSYGDILSILNYRTYSENNLTLDILGDDSQLIYHLENEMRLQFVSHKIELLTLLSLYVRNINRTDEVSSIDIFGINQFHHIWEDVCKVVYGDDLDKTINTLNLKYNGNKSLKLKEIVEKPIWHVAGIQDPYYSKESLELDVLSIDKINTTFNIYDAKYYLITFDSKNKKVIKAPGIGDITKQYLYELAYTNLANSQEPQYSFTNQLIVPKDNFQKNDGEVIATVSLPMFEKFNLSDIKIIARDCETIFTQYLNQY